MTPPKPLTPWQEAHTPACLPRHIRRNIAPGERGCWLWTRSCSPDGYGWASLNNRTYQAHRLVYTLVKGDIPEGLMIDHLCRIRACVNPAHMEPVSARENQQRSPITPAGRLACLKCGGPLTWYMTPSVFQRRCIPCARKRRAAYMREVRARAKAAA